MSTFLKLLPLELDEVKEYREPDMELEKNDHVVGVMSDDLKKLWTLWQQTAYRASELKLQLRYGEQNVSSGQVREMETKAKVINSVFWIAIADEFGLWDRPSTGVRKGFKVVWSDKPGLDMPPFLQHLLGLDE